jgi:hypothetical protein
MSMGSGGDTSIPETEDEKVSAEIGLERQEYYQNTFVPMENDYITEVQGRNDQSEHVQLSGDVSTEFKSNFSDVASANHNALSAEGIDPSSGMAKGVHQRTAIDQGASGSDATNRAQVELQDSYVGGLQQVVAMGEGQSTEAQQGLQDIANTSAQVATEKANLNRYESNGNKSLAAFGTGVVAESVGGG